MQLELRQSYFLMCKYCSSQFQCVSNVIHSSYFIL